MENVDLRHKTSSFAIVKRMVVFTAITCNRHKHRYTPNPKVTQPTI